MNYLKKLGISLLYVMISLVILSFIVTVLHYFGIIGKGFLTIMEILIPSIGFFLGGYQIGKRSKQKGWLEGIKFSLILFAIFIILNLLFKNSLEIKIMLYYVILMAFSTIGSMFGINKSN